MSTSHSTSHGSSHATASHGAHEKHAPGLPVVTDEAGDTPGWVPALGFGLFALIGMLIAVSVMLRDAAPAPAPTPKAEEAVAADAPAPAAPVAPGAPAPTPE